jgi:hypothetical protein
LVTRVASCSYGESPVGGNAIDPVHFGMELQESLSK